MKQDINLKLNQKQTITLNQNLQQMLKILQFSSVELSEFLEEEAIENPVVQMDMDASFSARAKKPTTNNDASLEDELWQISEPSSMYDIIREEAMLLDFTPEEAELAHYMIDNLDETGYYKHDLQITADDCNVSSYKVRQVLLKLQTLDPAGIFALDVIDNLNIQLARRDDISEYASVIINEYLDELCRNDLRAIKSNLDISAEELQTAVDDIRSLSPFPMVKDNRYVRYVEPDMLLTMTDEGDFIITYNDSYNKTLSINPSYYEMINNDSVDEATKDYIKQKISRINGINSSIRQRAKTLSMITTEIVNNQKQFFYSGELYFSSMTMVDVAKTLGLSESTISRAVKGKYIDTPRGIYPLKFFFHSAVKNKSGEKTSSMTIKEIIKDLVSKEDKRKPISDSKICEYIAKMGVEVSRRTVAKYRGNLGIPASSKRKRLLE